MGHDLILPRGNFCIVAYRLLYDNAYRLMEVWRERA